MAQLEICCTSLEEAIAAEKAGANRIELCEDLSVGGVSPRLKTIQQTTSILRIPIHVLIRSRAGNFVYSNSETQTMLQQIEQAFNYPIDGIVVGALTNERTINLEQAAAFRMAALNKKCFFHKAFDEIENQSEALEQLIDLKYDGILTSGGAVSAIEGQLQLQQLVQQAGNRLLIMPGGAIRSNNLSNLHQTVNASWYHSAASSVKGLSVFNSEVLAMKEVLANADRSALN